MSGITARTMCPMNCHPTFCGMTVEVENNRLVSVKGDEENPDSAGFLCGRGLASHQIMDNPKRLLQPLMRNKRGSDDWYEVSWDTAMERIVGAMNKIGREGVAVWPGHGVLSNDFGTFAHFSLTLRFANMFGCQGWDPSMICWGLGGLGIGLTGAMEINTKEDMAAHADLIVQWGSNHASQPNTARHIAAAKQRGAKVTAIDVRMSEACRSAHQHFIVKPGTDAAMALAMIHVIIKEGLYDQTFINDHTIGFAELCEHVIEFTPQWAAEICGIDGDSIAAFARTYANTERAMILLGGASMHKDQNGWQAARAISCLPPLTGKLGKAGAGFGPRHAAAPHGHGFAEILNLAAKPPGNYIPAQMSTILESIETRQIRAMLLFGANFASSFADAARVRAGLAKMDLVVIHDLFMNETIQQYADIVLPGTTWLEDVGVKATCTHIYLMDRILEPAGSARSSTDILKDLAKRLEIKDFYPWASDTGHIDAVLDHPSSGRATVASLRENGGLAPLNVSSVAHLEHQYVTPSGKIEFKSERATAADLPALPSYQPRASADHPLELRMGRSIKHFHAFYDAGRALPEMARRDRRPTLWISEQDATARSITDGDAIKMHNARGSFNANAEVSQKVPTGTVWMHDGWPGLNDLTSGAQCISDAAIKIFPFTAGQAAYDAFIEVSAL